MVPRASQALCAASLPATCGQDHRHNPGEAQEACSEELVVLVSTVKGMTTNVCSLDPSALPRRPLE